MDLPTTIIGLVLFVIFMSPILYIHFQQKTTQRKKYEDFISLAKEQKMVLSSVDIWSHYRIGIDNQANKLFYIKKHVASDKIDQLIIDLSQVNSCEILTTNNTVKDHNKKTYTVIAYLGLSITFKDKKPTLLLEFYNRNENIAMVEEVPLINKWHSLIKIHKR